MDVMFSVNQYDNEGDKTDDCILIYFNNDYIIRLNKVSELDDMISSLQKCRLEIAENYSDVVQ